MTFPKHYNNTLNKEQDLITLMLFETFNNENLNYAILRNYQNYPSFGHDIDLVCSEEDYLLFENIIQRIAKQFDWEIDKCSHWAKEPLPSQRIQVYRFYNPKNWNYLQIDLFGSLQSCGLPLWTASELLETKIHIGDFFAINPAIENAYRIVQLTKLWDIENNNDKIIRYKKLVIDFQKNNPDQLIDMLSVSLGNRSKTTVEALVENNRKVFLNESKKAKGIFILKQIINKPRYVIKSILWRIIYRLKYLTDSHCGCDLKVVCTPVHLDSFISALNELEKTGAIPCFGTNQTHNILQLAKIKERGGLAVLFSETEKANIQIDNDNIVFIKKTIMAFFRKRDQNLETK